MIHVMWNKSERSIKKDKINLHTPMAIPPNRLVTPGSFATMKQDSKMLVRSNDPRVTIDPPAIVPYTIDTEVNAQFSKVSKNNFLTFLYIDLRTEFCERNGHVTVKRHVYLLITDSSWMFVTTEPVWLDWLISV